MWSKQNGLVRNSYCPVWSSFVRVRQSGSLEHPWKYGTQSVSLFPRLRGLFGVKRKFVNRAATVSIRLTTDPCQNSSLLGRVPGEKTRICSVCISGARSLCQGKNKNKHTRPDKLSPSVQAVQAGTTNHRLEMTFKIEESLKRYCQKYNWVVRLLIWLY